MDTGGNSIPERPGAVPIPKILPHPPLDVQCVSTGTKHRNGASLPFRVREFSLRTGVFEDTLANTCQRTLFLGVNQLLVFSLSVF
jgi:hypothetical protein